MPTIRQKLVAKKILENPGSISKVMKEVGYAPSHAKNPQDLTESKGWHELMDQYLPDTKLLSVHTQGLDAIKIITSPTGPDMEVEDMPTRAKYLELGYKIKGKISNVQNNTQNNFFESARKQLDEYNN